LNTLQFVGASVVELSVCVRLLRGQLASGVLVFSHLGSVGDD
jgi:hypothetical protein